MRQPETGIRLLKELVAPAKRSFTDDEVRNRAELALGTACYRGVGVAKDDQAAVTWFESAARHGNELALALLSEIYSGNTDYKVPADAERAQLYRDTFEKVEDVKSGMEKREAASISSAIDYLSKRGMVKVE